MIKYYILSFVLVLIANISAYASNEKELVSLVSYEQTWLDSTARIALKNNTSHHIHNVSFLIEYQDMNGTPMDYKSFKKKIDIAPGMTKKIDIPAYEQGRFYQYYKSAKGYSSSNVTEFKIRYEFEKCNIKDGVTDKAKDVENVENTVLSSDLSQPNVDAPETENNISGGLAFGGIFLLITLLGLGAYICLYVLVYRMAKDRGRSPFFWLLLSVLFTPFPTALMLLVLGNNNCRISNYNKNELM